MQPRKENTLVHMFLLICGGERVWRVVGITRNDFISSKRKSFPCGSLLQRYYALLLPTTLFAAKHGCRRVARPAVSMPAAASRGFMQ